MVHEPLTELIVQLRREADGADFSALAERSIPKPKSRSGVLVLLRTRVAATAALLVVALGGLSGVAYAANGASPGDVLYGLDRALEAVGIGNGGASERISEAISLVTGGNPGQGLEHAANAVPHDAGVDSAFEEAIAAIPTPSSSEVEDEVLALLTYLKENVGSIDGATVAELAHSIGGRPDDLPGGPPEETPVGPPEETPAGPPEDTPGNGPPTTTTTTTSTTTTTIGA
jgi:hypothetical protein